MHVHLRNAAERAIQTWKQHFLAGIATLDPNFPIQEWDRLLPQCDITLNLVRSFRCQPNLSAYVATFGNFNFNRMPLAPPGTCVLIHKTTKQRAQPPTTHCMGLFPFLCAAVTGLLLLDNIGGDRDPPAPFARPA